MDEPKSPATVYTFAGLIIAWLHINLPTRSLHTPLLVALLRTAASLHSVESAPQLYQVLSSNLAVAFYFAAIVFAVDGGRTPGSP
jgi:hypothetical protein